MTNLRLSKRKRHKVLQRPLNKSLMKKKRRKRRQKKKKSKLQIKNLNEKAFIQLR